LFTETIIHPREIMDIRQLSEYLGISTDKASEYAASGKLPAFKLGNRWRFKRSLVDQWITAQCAEEMEKKTV
jgi:excisionase family DNA binding protein